MTSTTSAPPLTELHANGQQMRFDKPSPLRIPKKSIHHKQDDIFSCTSGSSDHSARGGSDALDAGDLPVIVRRRRPDDVYQAVGKENDAADYKSHISRGVEHDGHYALQEAKRWRGSSPAATFSASCGIRRAVKARPPLSNLHDASADVSWLGTIDQSKTSSPGLQTLAKGLDPLRRPGPAYVLAPYVEVTSEVATLAAGQHTWWAAIEVTGRLSPIPSGDVNLRADERSESCMEPHVHHQRAEIFEFGSLYDLTIEVLPTGNSSILQVLREQTFPCTICLGSSILVLAQIHIDLKTTPLNRKSWSGHVRQNSADLMEDLAAELGDARVGYSHIRVSYRHSAFPTYRDATSVGGGVSSVQSRVDTVATASVSVHNSLSPWSPPPARVLEALFPLMRRHWGLTKANAAIRQMGDHGYAPRVIGEANSQTWPQLDVDNDAHEVVMPVNSAHTAPPVPLRHASLQRDTGVRGPSVAMGPINEMRRVTPRATTASSGNSSPRNGEILSSRGPRGTAISDSHTHGAPGESSNKRAVEEAVARGRDSEGLTAGES
ncbi:hypothetical protein BGZ61DRAFT_472260 [Ilyonectria robusta]|uniref:uncharacterized protein n=1 Tax=Ilyonectria robusta TaxID=1079257 RepID=UPI001E8D825C|nr:uncharacterized protein BGZ61DRAFT_472260 [Ilyonectria robusta]KAH8735877.1 hypothetical protein BGZ61DRAFT_472260 [Ilyonectria robusta]